MADENREHSADTLVCDSGEELKSIETTDGKVRVGAYAVRFADKSEKDLTGDYFTKSTDFGPRNGDGTAAMFNHGIPLSDAATLKAVAEMQFGTVKTTRDDTGIFAETILDTSDKYAAVVAKMCEQGKLKWSSSTAQHVLRKNADGEITRWHPIEFSFTPKPAEPRLPAIKPLKSLAEDLADLIKAFTEDEADAADKKHFKNTCPECSAVTQCRCPAAAKSETADLCAKCSGTVKTATSMEDLRSAIGTAAQNDKRFNKKPSGNTDPYCGGPWVCDLVNDDGDWSAVIQAADGKYYEVDVAVADAGEVTLGDDATEVVRSSAYKPVEKKSIEVVDSGALPEPPTTAKTSMTDAEKKAARELEITEIKSTAAHFKCVEVGEDFIHLGKSLEDLRKHIAEEVIKARPVVTDPTIGMSKKEVKSYSFLKALREAHAGRLSGLELEASNATAKAINRTPGGFFFPHDVAALNLSQSHDLGEQAIKSLADAIKNLNQTTFASGGALVGTNLLTGSMIELLRNKPLMAQMGARGLSGLVGNIAIPSVTGGATAYWLNEQGSVTATDQSFGQLGLTPKRLIGRTGYTKELMNQTDISVEAFVRDDITTVLALAKDLAAINGTGGAQPLGILNVTGRSTDVTFGAAATRAKAISFQKNVAVNNASRGALAYLTTPSTAASWLNITEASNYPEFLWKGNIDSGMVVGRRAESTNQVPSDKVIYGNFNDLILADWAGIDVVVNPYTNDATGVVTITITLWTDCGIRHAVSFCVSTDSGAQ